MSAPAANALFEHNSQALEILHWHWRAAQNRHRDALKVLRCFLGAILHPTREPVGPLVGMPMIKPAERKRLLERQAALVEGVVASLHRAVADGEVRKCDPHAAGSLIVGLLLWTPTAAREIRPGRRFSRGRLQSALLELVRFGWSPAEANDCRCAGPPRRSAALKVTAASTLDAGLATASHLFNRLAVEADAETCEALRGCAKVVCGSELDVQELARLCHCRTVQLLLDNQHGANAEDPALAGFHTSVSAAEAYLERTIGLVSPVAAWPAEGSLAADDVHDRWDSFWAMQRERHAADAAAGRLRGRYHDLAPIFQHALWSGLAVEPAFQNAPDPEFIREIGRLLWCGLEPRPMPDSSA